jgi:hypothetical protein
VQYLVTETIKANSKATVNYVSKEVKLLQKGN